MRTLKFATAVALFAAALVPAAASSAIIGATSVHVTSALGSYIQITELEATQAGSGTNMALASNGGVATSANSYDSMFRASRVNDGIEFSNTREFYHSAGAASDFLDVSFAGAVDLASLTIFGRSDCCQERDVYDITVFGDGGSILYTGRLDNSALGGQAGTINFPNATAVPEPATWAMMVGGFGLVGAGLRRRAPTPQMA